MKKTRPVLLFSLAANLALAGAVAWMAWRNWPSAPEGNLPAEASAAQPPAVGEASEPAAAPAVKPFQWNQIESSDHETFAANLRAAGCPEPIIAAIIRAGEQAAIDARRGDIQAQEKMLKSQPATAESAARLSSLQAREQSLNKQQAALDSQLAGVSAAGTGNAPNAVASAASGNSQAGAMAAAAASAQNSSQQDPTKAARAAGVQIPLAFQPLDPSVKLTDEQQTIVNQLRQDFIDDLGGVNQDSSTPEYRQRWQSAQMITDQELRARLGVQAFLQWNLEAAQQAAAAGSTSGAAH